MRAWYATTAALRAPIRCCYADAIDRTAQRLLDIQGRLSLDDHMQNCRERSAQISTRWNGTGAAAAAGIGLQ